MTTMTLPPPASKTSPANFAVVAAAMAGLGAILSFVLLIARHARERSSGIVSQVKQDEQIVFFPSIAALDSGTNRWQVTLHAWVFEPEREAVLRKGLKGALRRAVEVPDNPESRRLFDERISLFLVDNERGKRIVVRLGSQQHVLGKTDAAGHVVKRVELSPAEMAAWRKGGGGTRHPRVRALLPARDAREFRGSVFVVPDEGLSVVSDIDDTIKITEVTNRRAMLANTFYRPFRPVKGMPELYRRLDKAGASFHYVSGSPWQLCQPLQAFLTREKFPAGSMHLRRFRLKDVRSLSELTKPENKPAAIAALLRQFPRRKFLFIGDSGERDPEIYAEFARKHPRQLAGIFIRNVTRELRTSKRMQTAFRGVPEKKWSVFDQPDELHAAMTAIVRRNRGK